MLNKPVFIAFCFASLPILTNFGCSKGYIDKGDAMIQEGATVKLHYTLTVDGQVVDTSSGKDPLTYTHGAGNIIPGLEKELVGMKKGDKKKVTVAPQEGYGEHNSQAIQRVPKKLFKETDELAVGGVVQGQQGDRPFQAVVTEIEDAEVTLDFNHPLAGKTLNFEVEVVEIIAPTKS